MLSSFWSFWVQAIVIGSMIACGILIVYTSKGQKKEETDETTGHSYDGIEELDNPLPRWWVGMFWATIVFGFGYIGIYGLANFDGIGTVKVDGEDVTWTQTNQWKAEVQAFDEKIAPLYAGYLATPIADKLPILPHPFGTCRRTVWQRNLGPVKAHLLREIRTGRRRVYRNPLLRAPTHQVEHRLPDRLPIQIP